MSVSEYKKLGPVDDLLALIERAGLPMPVKEFHFCPGRKWSADLAWPGRKLLLEVEGGIFKLGRHTRGKGFENDILKYNQAALQGFRLLRVTPDMIKGEYALMLIKEVLR